MLTATVPIPVQRESHAGAVADPAGSAERVGTMLPCQRGNPDLWFAETPAELERAKQLCGDCPLRAACLSSAIARGEPWGVWGGEIFERGSIIARKRPRGRPRKSAAHHESTTTNNHSQDNAA
ncbi:MAG: WhiB family transcriptional regulator [Sciscionella sp.]